MTQFFLRPLVPLIDTGSLKALEDYNGHADFYGRVRMMGSIGWIVCCLIMGRWLDYSGKLVHSLAVYVVVYAVLGVISLGGFTTDVKRVDFSWRYLLEDRILRVLIILTFVRAIGFSMGFTYIGVFLSEMDMNYTQMGMAFGLAAVLEIPFFFKGHLLRERWGGEMLILGDLLVQSLRFFLFFMLPHVQGAFFYIAVQLLAGVGICMHITGMIPLLNRIAPAHLKATYQNIYTVAMSLANIVSGLSASLIVKFLGTRSLMGVCSLIMLGAFFYTGVKLVMPVIKNNPEGTTSGSGL